MQRVRTAMHEAIAAGSGRLRTVGSPSPRLDVELLLAHLAGRDRAWVLAHPEAPVDAEAFESLLERRAAGEPVAYIRGFKEWHSLRIRTDRRALIPRPETELLADATIGEIEARLERTDGAVHVREVATGSGAVAVAVALRFAGALADRRVRLEATDISADALALATENLAAHGVDRLVAVATADLLEPTGADPPQVVVANLPYVASAEVDARRGSLGFEPRIAVDGGADGFDLLRRFLAELPDRVAPAATILLEIGAGQADAIGALAPTGASVSVVPDLEGLDRVVRMQLP